MTAIKERPILFSAEMVRAILAGQKTQTRRVIKPQPIGIWDKDLSTHVFNGIINGPHGAAEHPKDHYFLCPYGQPGDRLWVRETFGYDFDGSPLWKADKYGSQPFGPSQNIKWKPSIHMPRWASRIDLQITGIRVERLQEISEYDCFGEGVAHFFAGPEGQFSKHPIAAFRHLWQSINGPESWNQNPWVWVIEFWRIKP